MAGVVHHTKSHPKNTTLRELFITRREFFITQLEVKFRGREI